MRGLSRNLRSALRLFGYALLNPQVAREPRVLSGRGFVNGEENGSWVAAVLRALAGSGRNVQSTAAPAHSLRAATLPLEVPVNHDVWAALGHDRCKERIRRTRTGFVAKLPASRASPQRSHSCVRPAESTPICAGR